MLEIFFKNCMWSNIVEKSDCETITIILKELHIFSSKAKKWEGTHNEDNRAWTHGKILLSSLHLEFFQAVHNGQGDLYNQRGVELFPFTFVFQCYSEISKSAKYSHILCWCLSFNVPTRLGANWRVVSPSPTTSVSKFSLRKDHPKQGFTNTLNRGL